GLELVLHLVPQRGLPQRPLDPLADVAAEAVEPQAEGDVVEDAHHERIGLLEDHADVAADGDRIDAAIVDVGALQPDAALEPEAADEIVHSVERAQHRALAATGGPDETSDPPLLDLDVAVTYGHEAAVIHAIQLAVDHHVAVRRNVRP